MNIATCGHEVELDECTPGNACISTKAYDNEGNRAVSYMTVCKDCKSQLRKLGKILDTEQECLEWMRMEMFV